MGRIKTQQIKSKGEDIFAVHGQEYSGVFAQSKVMVSKHAVVRSKKLRNVLAGFLTRKARRARSRPE